MRIPQSWRPETEPTSRREPVDLMTPREAGAELGVSTASLLRWVRKRKWPTRPNGDQGWVMTPTGRYRFYRDAVRRVREGDLDMPLNWLNTQNYSPKFGGTLGGEGEATPTPEA